jgi:IS6 family transposase
MSNPSLFKWRHFQADIILCAVRWYLRYALSYRNVEELLRERGVWVDRTTISFCNTTTRPGDAPAAPAAFQP